MDITTLTMNPAIDVNTHVDQMVANRKLRCGSPTYEPGGGGINVARVIHELRGQAKAIYVAGGPTCELLKNKLEQLGISQQLFEINGRVREDIAIHEKTSGQLYRFVMPGPEMSDSEQKDFLKELKNQDTTEYIVISGSLPQGVSADFLVKVISELKNNNSKIILDTKASVLNEVLQKEKVFLIKPNMHELQELARDNLQTEKQQEGAARKISLENKADVVVASLGAGGMLLAAKDIIKRFRAPTVKIKSRVGAGDSALAAITLALSRDMSLADAVKYGIAAGTAAVMTEGTQLCRRQDVEKLFKQIT